MQSGGAAEGMVFGRSKSSSSTTPSAPSKAAAACSELRAAYHECFNRWYADKFAKGQWQRDDCADHWHKYRACLEVIPSLATPLLPPLPPPLLSEIPPQDDRLILLLCPVKITALFPLFRGTEAILGCDCAPNGGSDWILLGFFVEGIA